MNRYLIVVDMQKDFIDGALGTREAVAILPAVEEAVRAFEGTVLFTRDTHTPAYLDTQEGRNLPVVHCVRGTEGWQLAPGLQAFADARGCRIFDKPTFGSVELALFLAESHRASPIADITLVGLCTDICVISNALLLKAALPEVPIHVRAGCCAGVTRYCNANALRELYMCNILL